MGQVGPRSAPSNLVFASHTSLLCRESLLSWKVQNLLSCRMLQMEVVVFARTVVSLFSCSHTSTHGLYSVLSAFPGSSIRQSPETPVKTIPECHSHPKYMISNHSLDVNQQSGFLVLHLHHWSNLTEATLYGFLESSSTKINNQIKSNIATYRFQKF